MRDRLLAAEERNLSQRKEHFVKLTAALDAMSPLRVLARGYAIAADGDDRSVRSVEELSVGQTLRVHFFDGSAECTVEDLQRSKENGC